VKELKERLPREWRLLDHTIIMAAIAQWRSRLNACVRVNGGHLNINFEPLTFCCVLFVSSIVGFRKCGRCKHVHSANIV